MKKRLDKYSIYVVYYSMNNTKKDMDNKLKKVARYILKELETFKQDPEFFDEIKRTIQVKLWDKAKRKSFFTGKISKSALENGERVMEHWYGATRLALDIMEMKDPTVDKIVYEWTTKLTWNYTTSEENQVLKHNNQDYSLISELVNYKK